MLRLSLDVKAVRRSLASILVLYPAAVFSQVLLPPAQYQGAYQVSADSLNLSGNITQVGPLDISGGVGRYGTEVGILAGSVSTPSPSISFYSSMAVPGINGAAGTVQLQAGFFDATGIPTGQLPWMSYNILFVGPSAVVPVQVHAFVSQFVTALPTGVIGDQTADSGFSVGTGSRVEFSDSVHFHSYGRAQIESYTTDYAGIQTQIPYSIATGASGSLSDDHVWLARTNVTYTVELEAFQSLFVIGSALGGNLTAFSFADPTFQIASSVSDPSAYSILLSPGIGNSSVTPVPEPSTFALFGAGIALLVGARRRAQRNCVPALAFG